MFYCMGMMLYAILLINNRYCNVKLLQKILGKQKRSKDVVKNVLASIVLKGADIIISLLLVPLTINYLDVESYGIWLTLSETNTLKLWHWVTNLWQGHTLVHPIFLYLLYSR